MQILPDDMMFDDDELDEDEDEYDEDEEDDEDLDIDDDDEDFDGEEEDEEYEGYGESVRFDGIDFVRDGANRLMTADGVQTYEDWCRTCLSTEQDSLFCYPEDFGIDTSEIPDAESRGEIESILTNEITDALMADSRTESVEDIQFEWDEDGNVEVTISVIGVENEEIDVTVTM